MSTVPKSSPESPVAEAVLTLLKETFEGPSGPSTYYIDNDPRAGLFGAIDALSPSEASRAPRALAPSIAAHVHHVAFHAEMSSAWMRGDRRERDWKRSWSVQEVDAKEWDAECRAVRAEYEKLVRAIREVPAAVGEELLTTLGALAHAAYHLGEIRQRVADGSRPPTR
jgi:DinB superfamily